MRQNAGCEHLHRSLLDLIKINDGAPWVFVHDLRVGDVLSVQTQNTLYTFYIENPKEGAATITNNGKAIKEKVSGWIGGTTLSGTGTMVRVGGITIGLRLVLLVNGEEYILSPTREISVNGTKILPLVHRAH